MKKSVLGLILSIGSLFAQSNPVDNAAVGCALGASYMDLRDDMEKVNIECKNCIQQVPVMNVDKTEDVILAGTKKCITEYQNIRNSKK
ncbi:hypothetical protein [Sulfuricurvum sp.]|uniref:hypothetical protein n=1 Tax=Sulfuricurvum sp. TaxID=2025608 RepID=UPI002601CF47|nr:hypothetical protein [Sulfuricurvum sp.]MDD3594814.1 hypothetical protein [Sulfuricurvum sp.]